MCSIRSGSGLPAVRDRGRIAPAHENFHEKRQGTPLRSNRDDWYSCCLLIVIASPADTGLTMIHRRSCMRPAGSVVRGCRRRQEIRGSLFAKGVNQVMIDYNPLLQDAKEAVTEQPRLSFHKRRHIDEMNPADSARRRSAKHQGGYYGYLLRSPVSSRAENPGRDTGHKGFSRTAASLPDS